MIPIDIYVALQVSLSNSITYMFLIGAIIVLVAVVFTAFIKEVPLKSAEEYNEIEVKAEGAKNEAIEPMALEGSKVADGKLK